MHIDKEVHIYIYIYIYVHESIAAVTATRRLRLIRLRIVLSDTSQKLGPANPVWGRRTKRQLATVQIEDKAFGGKRIDHGFAILSCRLLVA